MIRALVTGATGFTGSHLVRDLVRSGQSVRALARNAQRAGSLPKETDVVIGDISDASAVARAVRGCDVVYHLAACFREAGVPDSRYREVHVDGTRHLLEAARAEGVSRFVHCSTIGVYSHIANPPADETLPHNPDDIYQQTKSEGERVATDFAREHGFPLSVIRPAAIYGPGDLRMLKLFRAIARRRFAMIGRGEVFLHMVHVDDLVRGLRLAAERPEAIGEAFIIAGSQYVTLNELSERIAGIWNVPPPRLHLPVWPFYLAGALCEAVCVPLRIEPPIFRRRVSFFTKSRGFSIGKARRLLGYEPQVDLQAGLQQTAAWYRQQGFV
ncbi:MAG: NAD-dependent epimerase/dehydratase family protein [Burkholderiaceae bacterium]